MPWVLKDNLDIPDRSRWNVPPALVMPVALVAAVRPVASVTPVRPVAAVNMVLRDMPVLSLNVEVSSSRPMNLATFSPLVFSRIGLSLRQYWELTDTTPVNPLMAPMRES